MESIKGPGTAPSYDGSQLRVGIVHSRWNSVIVDALVAGARKSLAKAGVKDENVLVQSVPGSWELPVAAQCMFAGSRLQNSSEEMAPLDAIIAIGVLIKGETMHFEYISDAVSHGLMRLQMELQRPVIFGVLTLLEERQGMARAGLLGGGDETNSSHNHGEDWGLAAVEMGVKRRAWAAGEKVLS